MSTRPNVIPSDDEKRAAEERVKQLKFEAEKAAATNQIYEDNKAPADTPEEHRTAVEIMQQRTQQQLEAKKRKEVIQYPELAEQDVNRTRFVTQPVVNEEPKTRQQIENEAIYKRAEEQMKIRDELLNKNIQQTENYHRMSQEAEKRHIQQTPNPEPQPQPRSEPIAQPTYTQPEVKTQPVHETASYGKTPSNVDNYLIELSQPNYNSPYDVIPLPSKGKIYKCKKGNIKLATMTTADENILTSPNLLRSGDFLKILINRKVLEPEIRYENLHVGDRNAIMLYLRATAYGEMYPITLLDEEDIPFSTEIDLNTLKYKDLGAEPDAEGLFDFVLPKAGNLVKFKFLNCSDADEIDALMLEDEKNGVMVNKRLTYTLERIIVEVDGNRGRSYISEFIENLGMLDSRKLAKYIEEIESGVDLMIDVRTPGGGSVRTFLPFTTEFFWPQS